MKLMIVDDRALIGQAVGALVKHRIPQAEVSVATLENAQNRKGRVDLILLVINSETNTHDRIFSDILERTRTPTVALVDEDDKENARILLKLGVRGIMFTSDSVAELLTTLRLCHQGFSYVPPKVVAYSRQRDRNLAELARQCQQLGLTNRQVQVLQLMSKRLSNKEIAEELVVSLATVKTHINHIYSALHVNNRRDCLAKVKQLVLLLNITGPKRAI